MKKSRTISRRRSKSQRPFKLVIYLSETENRLVEQAAASTGRSKSAFGAEVILNEAKRVLHLAH
jgi:hypothetical protein